jgi:arylsulfatase B
VRLNAGLLVQCALMQGSWCSAPGAVRLNAGLLVQCALMQGFLMCPEQQYGSILNSLVCICSDNGGAVTLGDLNRNDPADVYRSNYASNMPLRGQKTTYFEGGVRSAAFVSGAGVHGSGSKSSAMIHVTDLYPSLLAHAARGIGDSPGSEITLKDVLDTAALSILSAFSF